MFFFSFFFILAVFSIRISESGICVLDALHQPSFYMEQTIDVSFVLDFWSPDSLQQPFFFFFLVKTADIVGIRHYCSLVHMGVYRTTVL